MASPLAVRTQWILNGSSIEFHEKKHQRFSLSGVWFGSRAIQISGVVENELSTLCFAVPLTFIYKTNSSLSGHLSRFLPLLRFIFLPLGSLAAKRQWKKTQMIRLRSSCRVIEVELLFCFNFFKRNNFFYFFILHIDNYSYSHIC